MQNQPYHYYLVTAVIFYENETGMKTFPLNSMVALTKKKIPLDTLHGLEGQMMDEFSKAMEVPKEKLVRIVFQNFSYLGLMTESEWKGNKPAGASVN